MLFFSRQFAPDCLFICRAYPDTSNAARWRRERNIFGISMIEMPLLLKPDMKFLPLASVKAICHRPEIIYDRPFRRLRNAKLTPKIFMG